MSISDERSCRRQFPPTRNQPLCKDGFSGYLFGNPIITDGTLFVDNPYRAVQQIHVEVVKNPEGDRELILDGVYRVPPGHALEFDGVLEKGEQYTVSARYPDTPPADALQNLVQTCDADDLSGQTTVRVKIARDLVSMVVFGYDKGFTHRDDVESLDVSEYRVEDTATNTLTQE